MEDPFPGSREVIGKAFETRLIPSSTIPAILASLADTTLKQYSGPLRSWWNFYQQRQIPIYSPSVPQFLEFLSQELPDISSYSCLNTMRSAISLISQNEIGKHPIVRRFCKGVAVLKPPRPRYDYVWDPAPVIAKLSAFYPYDSLDLKTLTKKLVILLALAMGQRVQTLASIKIPHISLSESLIVRVPDRIKTLAPGRAQPFFRFLCFSGHENLYIVHLMEAYLEKTKNLRPPTCDNFFIALNEPHKPVTTQTISRWIRRGLEDCEINTTIFSAHSTCHASTSRAAERGVSLELIKRAAGWTGESRVFAKFYNRPIVNPEDFCNAVLLT